jgi:CheY-like chemotaxis protein
MDGRGLGIAIVDDEEKLRVALGRLLRAHGHDTEAFATGQALIAAIARRRFDCVVLDLFMPGMSGFDVLAVLQAMPAAPPVVVVSAHDDPELAQRAFALGAAACRHKPIGALALLHAIEGVLPGRASRPDPALGQEDRRRH